MKRALPFFLISLVTVFISALPAHAEKISSVSKRPDSLCSVDPYLRMQELRYTRYAEQAAQRSVELQELVYRLRLRIKQTTINAPEYSEAQRQITVARYQQQLESVLRAQERFRAQQTQFENLARQATVQLQSALASCDTPVREYKLLSDYSVPKNGLHPTFLAAEQVTGSNIVRLSLSCQSCNMKDYGVLVDIHADGDSLLRDTAGQDDLNGSKSVLHLLSSRKGQIDIDLAKNNAAPTGIVVTHIKLYNRHETPERVHLAITLIAAEQQLFSSLPLPTPELVDLEELHGEEHGEQEPLPTNQSMGSFAEEAGSYLEQQFAKARFAEAPQEASCPNPDRSFPAGTPPKRGQFDMSYYLAPFEVIEVAPPTIEIPSSDQPALDCTTITDPKERRSCNLYRGCRGIKNKNMREACYIKQQFAAGALPECEGKSSLAPACAAPPTSSKLRLPQFYSRFGCSKLEDGSGDCEFTLDELYPCCDESRLTPVVEPGQIFMFAKPSAEQMKKVWNYIFLGWYESLKKQAGNREPSAQTVERLAKAQYQALFGDYRTHILSHERVHEKIFHSFYERFEEIGNRIKDVLSLIDEDAWTMQCDLSDSRPELEMSDALNNKVLPRIRELRELMWDGHNSFHQVDGAANARSTAFLHCTLMNPGYLPKSDICQKAIDGQGFAEPYEVEPLPTIEEYFGGA